MTTALTLTDVQQWLVQAAADGEPTRDTAVRLGTTTDAIKAHWSRICTLLGARDRAHAVIIALRAGLIT